MSIVVLHFQALEKYPPILNFIRDLEREEIEKVSVLSTNNSNNWFKSSISIFRWGTIGSSKWIRYATYIIFNLFALCYLLIKRPTKVVYYETLSCWSVYWYKKIRSNTKVFIHFHEYTSEEEKNRSSAYYKNLLVKEIYLLQQADWVSHTNEDRMRLFRLDYPFLRDRQCHVFPNYPPADWSARAQNLRKQLPNSDSIKLVYVGALGMQTTYIQELAEWIQEQRGKYSLDIYTDNIEQEVKGFLLNLNSSYINLKAAITYFDLPEVLAHYDIGVVLYKGHIPNYVYNVPNKVMEYLACGLQVICSIELKSCLEFKKRHILEAIHMINFKNINTIKTVHPNFETINYNYIFQEYLDLLNKLKNNAG
jgi:glycosyltransferase involved in cell wall biosynthesis